MIFKKDEIIPAIAALREYINLHYGGSVSRFARENRLDVGVLGRIMREDSARGTRMSVALAIKIENATKGSVPIDLWTPVEEE